MKPFIYLFVLLVSFGCTNTKPLTKKHYFTNINGGCWERTWIGFHYTDTIYKNCKCKDVKN